MSRTRYIIVFVLSSLPFLVNAQSPFPKPSDNDLRNIVNNEWKSPVTNVADTSLHKDVPPPSLSDRLTLGGNMRGSFDNGARLDLSPTLMYEALKGLNLGLGINLGYSQDSLDRRFDIGGNSFLRYRPGDRLPFFQFEYALINRMVQDNSGTGDVIPPGNTAMERERKWEGAFSLGLGYNAKISEKLGLEFSVMYDLSDPRDNGVPGPINGPSQGPWSFRWGLTGSLGHVGQGLSRLGKEGLSGAGTANSAIMGLLGEMGLENQVSVSLGRPTTITYSPTINIDLDSNLTIGLGPNLRFAPQTSESTGTEGTPGNLGESTRAMDIGGRFFARYTPKKHYPYLQLEYSGNSIMGDSTTWGAGERRFMSSVLLGTGYSLSIKGIGSFQVGVMRDLNYADTKRYKGSPWEVRAGFSLDFMGIGDAFRNGKLDHRALLQAMIRKLELNNSVSVSGADPLSINVSPSFKIDLDSTWSLGFGPVLQLSQHRESEREDEILNWGGRIFGRFSPGRKLPYLQLEYEGMMAEGDSLIWGEGVKRFISSLYVGIGHKINLKDLGSLELGILRNLTYEGVTPVHNSPWVFRTGLSTKLFQETAPGKFRFALPDLMFLEGTIGASFGKVTMLDISPMFGHNFNEHYSAGMGPSFKYIRDKEQGTENRIYGGRVFARARPKKRMPFGQVEYENMNSRQDPLDTDNFGRTWTGAFLVGAGMNFPVGQRSGINMTVLRDVTWDGPTPVRGSPWEVRFGFQL